MELISKLVAIFAIVLTAAVFPATASPGGGSNTFAPAPSPVSDGTAIDQGIAYVLMLLALVLTYIIH